MKYESIDKWINIQNAIHLVQIYIQKEERVRYYFHIFLQNLLTNFQHSELS
jgi:hypothetical protein